MYALHAVAPAAAAAAIMLRAHTDFHVRMLRVVDTNTLSAA